ncbi:6-phosphogluconolactonase [Pacificimonas sp. WHA3]|uniref:6-phosphogluconolactonase n=1 Tax=Pacificimonas pallii TaxID=2827236 RepID=A0ABS6SD37_9SPHN|nr:6-phosphogluconolactonase [Pacificimonas pallii]MBV7256270.1 6-phosphogluconolactonase [Pacificimonas pallii]
MTEYRWHKYADREEMADAAADKIARTLRNTITIKGTALMFVPGGGTPVPVFAALCGMSADWNKVTVVPGDERLVPPGDPLSNFGMIEQAFADTDAATLALLGDDTSRSGAAADAESRLAMLKWPPDIVWLGMGADGHTASIFPGLDLEKALNTDGRVVAAMPNPLPDDAPVPRVTLSRAAIRSAANIIVTITGGEKRDLLERALEEGDHSLFPIGRVLAGQDVDIFWSS